MSERQLERPEPPNFELLVIGLGIPFSEVGLLEQFARVRAHLRREISKRLIERRAGGARRVPVQGLR